MERNLINDYQTSPDSPIRISNGCVGIGLGPEERPQALLHVKGDAIIQGNVLKSSDSRLKHVVGKVDQQESLSFINSVVPVKYTLNGDR